MSASFVAASNQKLEIPGPVTATASKSIISGMCWVRLNSVPVADDMDFLQYSTGTSLTQSRWGLSMIPGGGSGLGILQIKGRAADGDTLRTFQRNAVSAGFLYNTWQHIGAVLDYGNSFAYLYVNGFLKSAGPMNGTFGAATTAATASLHGRIGGGLTDPTQGTDGEIEDARLYSGILGEGIFETIFTLQGKDSIRNNLLHRWPLKDRNSGSIVTAANLAETERIVALPVNGPVWLDASIISFQKQLLRKAR